MATTSLTNSMATTEVFLPMMGFSPFESPHEQLRSIDSSASNTLSPQTPPSSDLPSGDFFLDDDFSSLLQEVGTIRSNTESGWDMERQEREIMKGQETMKLPSEVQFPQTQSNSFASAVPSRVQPPSIQQGKNADMLSYSGFQPPFANPHTSQSAALLDVSAMPDVNSELYRRLPGLPENPLHRSPSPTKYCTPYPARVTITHDPEVLVKILIHGFVCDLPEDKPCIFETDLFDENCSSQGDPVMKKVARTELDASGKVAQWFETIMVHGEIRKYRPHALISADRTARLANSEIIEGFCTIWTRKYPSGCPEVDHRDQFGELVRTPGSPSPGPNKMRASGVIQNTENIVWQYSVIVTATLDGGNSSTFEINVPDSVVNVRGVSYNLEPDWTVICNSLRNLLRKWERDLGWPRKAFPLKKLSPHEEGQMQPERSIQQPDFSNEQPKAMAPVVVRLSQQGLDNEVDQRIVQNPMGPTQAIAPLSTTIANPALESIPKDPVPSTPPTEQTGSKRIHGNISHTPMPLELPTDKMQPTAQVAAPLHDMQNSTQAPKRQRVSAPQQLYRPSPQFGAAAVPNVYPRQFEMKGAASQGHGQANFNTEIQQGHSRIKQNNNSRHDGANFVHQGYNHVANVHSLGSNLSPYHQSQFNNMAEHRRFIQEQNLNPQNAGQVQQRLFSQPSGSNYPQPAGLPTQLNTPTSHQHPPVEFNIQPSFAAFHQIQEQPQANTQPGFPAFHQIQEQPNAHTESNPAAFHRNQYQLQSFWWM